MNFGERLRAERQRLGLSQAEAAELLGVGRVSLGHYENSRALPTVDILESAKKAGMDPLWLVFGPEKSQAAIEAINLVALQAVVLAVAEFVRTHNLALEAGAEGALVRTLYLQFERLRDQGQSNVNVGDLLRAAA